MAIAWMRKWFELYGDKMPDNKMIHLPHFLSREAVHKELVEDYRSKGLESHDIISLSRFYMVWTKNFPHVTIPRVSMHPQIYIPYHDATREHI